MKSDATKSLLTTILMLFAFCSAVSAQTLDIGADTGNPGDTVTIPVTLTAAVDCTAALVRVEYDPAVLENPSATPGAILSEAHTLDASLPAAGRLNVSVYAASGAPAFTAQTGVLFDLTFDIRADAPTGQSNITITTSGTPALPASDLTAASGAVVAHTATGGSVTVETEASVQTPWMLY